MNSKTGKWRAIIKPLALIPACWLLGLLALWLVYLLPGNAIYANLKRSAATLVQEGDHPELIAGLEDSVQDNFTDSLMLNIAGNKAGDGQISALNRSLNQYYAARGAQVTPESSPVALLEGYVSSPEKDIVLVAYGRYWGGFAIPIRLALTVMPYDSMRVANGICQVLLLFAAIWAVWRNIGLRQSIALAIAYLALQPLVMPLSLQYADCFYLAFGGVLYIATVYSARVDCGEPRYVFVLLGIMTAYFDFLTYPLFTLCLPLLIYRSGKSLAEHKGGIKESIGSVLRLSMLWGAGYLGMWAGKWLLALIAGYPDVLASALSLASYRTSLQTDMDANRLSVIGKVFGVYSKKMLAALLLPTLAIVATGIVKARRLRPFPIRKAIPYLLIMSFPFLWLVVVNNHSSIHYWFTYRNLAIVFSGLYLMAGDLWLPHNLAKRLPTADVGKHAQEG